MWGGQCMCCFQLTGVVHECCFIGEHGGMVSVSAVITRFVWSRIMCQHA